MLALLIPEPARGEANETSPALEAAVSAGTDYSPLTPGGKFRLHLKSTVDVTSIFGSAFSAGYGQMVDSMPEWGQGMEGYGKRFADSMGKKAVNKTVCSSLKILLREDPRYFYSDKQSVKSRIFHAIGETFVAHKDSGGKRPDYSYFAGLASGVYISRQWRPESYRGATDYITDVAASIGTQSVKNVFLEFLPVIKKKFLPMLDK